MLVFFFLFCCCFFFCCFFFLFLSSFDHEKSGSGQTNISSPKKDAVFTHAAMVRRCNCPGQRRQSSLKTDNITDDTVAKGEKTRLFEPFICKMHLFTKTGSGQT
jgi:hypothetical protein